MARTVPPSHLRILIPRPQIVSSPAHQSPRYQSTTSSTSSTSSTTALSSITHLTTSLTQRHLPIIYDNLSPTNSHLLSVLLAPLLPHTAASPIGLATANNPPQTPARSAQIYLPPSHHLVYFPPTTPGLLLLPDGTDLLQSPGGPFIRRMWAGGSVRFRPPNSIRTLKRGDKLMFTKPGAVSVLPLNGGRMACVERIADVAVKGLKGQEKVFVGIERRVGRIWRSEGEGETRARFSGGAAAAMQDDAGSPAPSGTEEDDFANAELIERRTLVFMRERTREQAHKDMEVARTRQLKPPEDPRAFEHIVTPDPRLLFRYSALTYNAHAIHLDPVYCREVEGHRGLLVHGPLSFTLILTMLRVALRQKALTGQNREQEEYVKSVEYRALSPLYADEPLKLCGVERGKGKWDVWAETPEGGVAVMAKVRTEVGELVQYPDLEMLGL